jgi:hypothetical protein
MMQINQQRHSRWLSRTKFLLFEDGTGRDMRAPEEATTIKTRLNLREERSQCRAKEDQRTTEESPRVLLSLVLLSAP